MTKEEVADIAAEDSKDPDLLKAETAEKSVESNAEAAINTTIASEDSETVKTDLTKEESKEAKALHFDTTIGRRWTPSLLLSLWFSPAGLCSDYSSPHNLMCPE